MINNAYELYQQQIRERKDAIRKRYLEMLNSNIGNHAEILAVLGKTYGYTPESLYNHVVSPKKMAEMRERLDKSQAGK